MNKKSPWSWVPTLYFAEGLPYAIVVNLSLILFKRLGISNTEIAFYTSWLYLPWIIKWAWSPLVDMFKTKRWWILIMQLLIGGGLAAIAFVLPGPHAFRYAIAFMWLMAFSSATHDIAADGFYMLGLSTQQQAFFVGWRNTFYRLALLSGQGLIVMLAGYLEQRYGTSAPESIAIPQAWSVIFFLLSGLFLLLFIYHRIILPRPASDAPATSNSNTKFYEPFRSFFKKKGIWNAITFILLFRLAESQLVKIASPFLLDAREIGGLGLSTSECGFAYGTAGLIALTIGGILGGLSIAKQGLKHWIWWMTLSMNIPNLVYLYMAIAQPSSLTMISACVMIEQFGYGFGFTALTFFMMLFSQGKQQTAHYAICTGIMALGMMIPGMASGWIQDTIGYQSFFIWIMICTIPSFIAARRAIIPEVQSE